MFASLDLEVYLTLLYLYYGVDGDGLPFSSFPSSCSFRVFFRLCRRGGEEFL